MWAKIYKGISYAVEDISGNRAEWVDMLPQIEKERYHNYKNKNAAELFLLGRILLRKELSAAYSLPFDTEIEIDSNGKPFLKGGFLKGDFPHFSISHSKEKVAVAIADIPVGIDIQKLVTHNSDTLLAMGQKVFSEQEMFQFGKNPTQELFTQMWVAKESYVKMLGTGLANASALNLGSNIYHYKTQLPDDYFLSLIAKIPKNC